MEELKEYIAYSRAHCKPELTDQAAAALVDGYLNMRAMGISRKVFQASSPTPPHPPCGLGLRTPDSCCSFWCCPADGSQSTRAALDIEETGYKTPGKGVLSVLHALKCLRAMGADR